MDSAVRMRRRTMMMSRWQKKTRTPHKIVGKNQKRHSARNLVQEVNATETLNIPKSFKTIWLPSTVCQHPRCTGNRWQKSKLFYHIISSIKMCIVNGTLIFCSFCIRPKWKPRHRTLSPGPWPSRHWCWLSAMNASRRDGAFLQTLTNSYRWPKWGMRQRLRKYEKLKLKLFSIHSSMSL